MKRIWRFCMMRVILAERGKIMSGAATTTESIVANVPLVYRERVYITLRKHGFSGYLRTVVEAHIVCATYTLGDEPDIAAHNIIDERLEVYDNRS